MSDFKKTWKEGFVKYAIDLAVIYRDYPEQIMCCMSGQSVVGSLNETYQLLVKENELLPIEKLEESMKLELWNKSKQYAADKKHCEMICRSIYLLNELTKK